MAGQPNMNAMLKQVQKMQADMAKAQEELKNEVVEASAGGGMVTVKVSGDLEVKEIRIDPEAVDPEDVELLQDMVLAAVNEARPLRPGAGRLEAERGDRRPRRRRRAGRTRPARVLESPRLCSPRRSTASSPSSRACPASGSAPRSGSRSTC